MPVNITSVSFTFHDERKREEYGPVKKAEATITASVGENEDGVAVLDVISFIATNKVRAALTIEGITQSTAGPSTAGSPALHGPYKGTETAGEQQGAEPPKTRVRRTKEQIAADEAAKRADVGGDVAGPQPEIDPPDVVGVAQDEWDQTVAVVITAAEVKQQCSATAERLGEGGPARVRAVKELYNPQPGQPFTVDQIPTELRAAFVEKLQALA